MTPNFALSLSFEGIGLLRRMGPRWARIDEVSLDHDDFDAQVIALRDRAEALDPTGAQVALIIPNEQIRYLDQPDLGGDAAARDLTIRASLDGATPYAVSELRYDHVVSGGRLLIAAVAQETLDEAQGFAREHGFEPVCYLANPAQGEFDGAVFFGKASGWGRAVSRPARALDIVAADKAALEPLPKPELTTAPVSKPVVPPKPAPQPKKDTAAKPKPTAQDPAPVAEPVAPEPPTAPVAKPARASKQDDAKAPVAAPPVSPTAVSPTAPEPGPVPKAETEAPMAFSTRRSGRDSGPGTAAAVTGSLRPRFTPVPTPEGPEEAPAAPNSAPKSAPKSAPRTGFFNAPTATALLAQAAAAADAQEGKVTAPAPVARREPDTTPKPAAKPAAPNAPKRSELPPRLKPKPKPAAKSGPKPLPKVPAARPAGALPVPPAQDGAVPAPVAARQTAPDEIRAPRPNPLAKLAALRAPRQDNLGGSPLAMPSGGAAAIGAAPGGAMFGKSDERDQMTVFGARARGGVGGSPRRLGLVLTAFLLLFLVGIAAWASVFLDEGLARLFRSDDEPPASAVASLPDAAVIAAPDPVAGNTGVLLESASPAASPVVSLRPVARPEAEPQLAALDTPEVTPDAPIPALSVPIDPRELTPEEAAATYAATGIWQRAPIKPRTPPTDGVDDIYAASIDPNIQIFDAVALPDAKDLAREAALADPGLPPPAGLTFDFNERDLVRATPEGALTPEGLRIYTGRPPLIPPLRGASTAAAPAPDAEDPETIRGRINAMPRIRPQARPSDIIEQRERSQLRGITVSELASIRPTMRPRTVQEQAAVDIPEATDQAVTRSLVPVSRPRDMATIVKQADRSLAPEPVQTAAAVAPRTIAPNIPSSASVARSATLENAINLKKINLIGIYGTSDNRRALVRLANGKYEKVQVGDRLDGGKVTAISNEELRYTKGGRNLSLKMPRG